MRPRMTAAAITVMVLLGVAALILLLTIYPFTLSQRSVAFGQMTDFNTVLSIASAAKRNTTYTFPVFLVVRPGDTVLTVSVHSVKCRDAEPLLEVYTAGGARASVKGFNARLEYERSYAVLYAVVKAVFPPSCRASGPETPYIEVEAMVHGG